MTDETRERRPRYMSVYMGEDNPLWETLEAAAEAERRSVSQTVRIILERHFNEQEAESE